MALNDEQKTLFKSSWLSLVDLCRSLDEAGQKKVRAAAMRTFSSKVKKGRPCNLEKVIRRAVIRVERQLQRQLSK